MWPVLGCADVSYALLRIILNINDWPHVAKQISKSESVYVSVLSD